MVLSHAQQHGHVLFADDMSLAEHGPLLLVFDDLCNVVAEHMPHRILGTHQFHGLTSLLLLSDQLCSAEPVDLVSYRHRRFVSACVRLPRLRRRALFKRRGKPLVKTNAPAPSHGLVREIHDGRLVQSRAVGVVVLADDLRDPRIAELPQPPRAERGVVLFTARDIVQQRGGVYRLRVKTQSLAPQSPGDLVRKRGHRAAMGFQRRVGAGSGQQRPADLVRERGPRRSEQLAGNEPVRLKTQRGEDV